MSCSQSGGRPAANVTVITPSYNRGHLLPRVWRSLRIQAADFEWIVVDDGSTDDTASVVAALGDERIVLVRLPSNRGVNAARNAGVDTATGKYIVFIDSDDEVAPGGLAVGAQALSEAGSTIGAALLRARVAGTERDVAPLPNRTVLDEVAVVCEGALAGDYGVVYRREVFAGQRLPEDLRGCEHVFVYGISKRFKFKIVDATLSIIHRQNDNLCSPESVVSRSRDIAVSYERIVSAHCAILQLHPAAACRYLRRALYRYAIAKDLPSAWRVFLRAIKRSPTLREAGKTTAVGIAGLVCSLGPERLRLQYRNWRLTRGPQC